MNFLKDDWLVPVIVGSVLGALVIVVIVAYIIGRRRKSGPTYETMWTELTAHDEKLKFAAFLYNLAMWTRQDHNYFNWLDLFRSANESGSN